MAKKTDKPTAGRRDVELAPHQPSAALAVGDDLPRPPAVQDNSRPTPGSPPGKRDQTSSRSSEGGEK